MTQSAGFILTKRYSEKTKRFIATYEAVQIVIEGRRGVEIKKSLWAKKLQDND